MIETVLIHWSTFANGTFWLMLIALDVWVLRKFSVFKYGTGTVTDTIKPYLKTKMDLFLWILIYIWFIALVLLETYSLFTIWAGCFVSCLDARMRHQGTVGKASTWAILLGVPSILLFAVVISLAFACASLCELVGWNQDWNLDEQPDEEKGFLQTYADEKEALEEEMEEEEKEQQKQARKQAQQQQQQ